MAPNQEDTGCEINHSKMCAWLVTEVETSAGGTMHVCRESMKAPTGGAIRTGSRRRDMKICVLGKDAEREHSRQKKINKEKGT